MAPGLPASGNGLSKGSVAPWSPRRGARGPAGLFRAPRRHRRNGLSPGGLSRPGRLAGEPAAPPASSGPPAGTSPRGSAPASEGCRDTCLLNRRILAMGLGGAQGPAPLRPQPFPLAPPPLSLSRLTARLTKYACSHNYDLSLTQLLYGGINVQRNCCKGEFVKTHVYSRSVFDLYSNCEVWDSCVDVCLLHV